MIVVAIIILIVAGFLWYRGWKTKQASVGEMSSSGDSSFSDVIDGADSGVAQEIADLEQAEADFNAKCENGEWVKIGDAQETATLSGKVRRVYPDEESAKTFGAFQFFLEGTEKIGLAGGEIGNLDPFEDREAEVKGAKSADGKTFAVSEARCAGAETDKNLISERTNLLNWLVPNINAIAPKKAPHQKWVVSTADFVDGKNAYIEYYDMAEDSDDSAIEEDTSRMILAEISADSGKGYSVKILAYWEMGTDDYELKTGSDKFENVEETTMYEYDSEDNSWTRI